MSGRVVVITGSAGGIGGSMMLRFAELGDVPVGLDLADGFDVSDLSAVGDVVQYLAAPTTFTTGIDLLVDGGISGIRIVEDK